MLELLVVLAIVMVAAAIFTPNIVRMRSDMLVANGYDTVLMTVRKAREAAIVERRVYILTLTAPRTVSIAPATTTPNGLNLTLSMPNTVSFVAETGLPSTATTTPDRLGLGPATGAIYFDVGVTTGGTNTIYFYPDGSARDINGNMNNGVAYIAHPGEIASARAITVWGASGRIRGWRLQKKSSGTYWSQQ